MQPRALPNGWTLGCGRPRTTECQPADAAASTTEPAAAGRGLRTATKAGGRQLQRLLGPQACFAVRVCIQSGLPEWDADKAVLNLRKHGVDFADAVAALTDERAVTVSDDDPDEERFVTLGMDSLGRILVVVYTWRADDVRLISARKATSDERRQYEKRR